MGPRLEWVAAAYSGRPQITIPYGLGDTTDLTNALSVLKLAGLHAVVETHDTIRLADGRRARLDLPLIEQAERLISAGCRISRRAISDRPGYPAISKREMPYRLVAFTEQEVDMAALGFEPDTVGFAGTELIRPADPTIFLTAAAAGHRDRTDDITTANTLLRADYRNDDDAASLQEVRDRLQFLADTGYDLRHNLPD